MERWLPSRYFAFLTVAALLVLAVVRWDDALGWRLLAVLCAVLTAVGISDLVQKTSTLRRNYPLLVHVRYFFEKIRPMLRQYIVESDNEEVPFSNVQRAIHPRHNPTQETLDRLLQPFGLKLSLAPIEQSPDSKAA